MLSAKDLVATCDRLTRARLDHWLDEGWLTPASSQQGNPAFSELDRARADLICHLMDDLDIREDTMPVILSLMDQVYSLRSDLRALMHAVAAQPSAVRTEISLTVRAHQKNSD